MHATFLNLSMAITKKSSQAKHNKLLSNGDVLLRLRLAQSFLHQSKANAHNNADDISLSMAIVQLHDCLDNLLGALISFQSITSVPVKIKAAKQPDSLIKSWSDVFLPKNNAFMQYDRHVRKLNKLRNDIKHQGVVVVRSYIVHTTEQVLELCNAMSKKFFGQKLAEFNLIDLLTEGEEKEYLKHISDLIKAGKYKESLAGSALFWHRKLSDRSFSVLISSLESFIKQDDYEGHPIDMNRHGLDAEYASIDIMVCLQKHNLSMQEYIKFDTLTPNIYKVKNRSRIFDDFYAINQVDVNQGSIHDLSNSQFCLNFVTSLALASQQQYGRRIKKEIRARIRFKRKSTIYFESDGEFHSEGLVKPLKRHERYCLKAKKDDIICGHIYTYYKLNEYRKLNYIVISFGTGHPYDIDIDNNNLAFLELATKRARKITRGRDKKTGKLATNMCAYVNKKDIGIKFREYLYEKLQTN